MDSGDVFLIAATADQACQYVDLSNHSATYSCKTVKRLLSVTFPIRLLIYLLDISQSLGGYPVAKKVFHCNCPFKRHSVPDGCNPA